MENVSDLEQKLKNTIEINGKFYRKEKRQIDPNEIRKRPTNNLSGLSGTTLMAVSEHGKPYNYKELNQRVNYIIREGKHSVPEYIDVYVEIKDETRSWCVIC